MSMRGGSEPNVDLARPYAREPLAILAHELRTPIGAIRNAVSIMEAARTLPGAVERAREVIARQIGQLSVLVEDLLDVSNVSRGTLSLHRQSIDVVPEIHAAIDSCAWVFSRCAQNLVAQLPDAPLLAYVDGIRLRQVVINLLDNACKYTPAHGRIELQLYRADAELVVRVNDNGSGIAPDRLPYVFDLYTRACQDVAGSPRGLGIGLALVREIVRLHGGHVEARSDGPGCGSAFTVHLPMAALASAETL
jgi:signal transduction histidine kinase